MGLFGKNRDAAVPGSVIGTLAEYGKAALASRSGSPIDQRFGWDYISPVVLAMAGAQRERVIQELYDAAHAAPGQPLVTVGAYSLMSEADHTSRDPRFLELRDATLEYMRRMRYSSGHLTRIEADRWIERHGDLRSSFDNIVGNVIPTPAEAPAVKDLSPGETRLLALTGPLPDGNAFYAERQGDGRYLVFSERPRNSDDPTRARYDERELGTFTAMAICCAP